MFATLRDAGFQIAFHAHAEAILGVDFPEVAVQLEAILLASAIPIEEIVGSGGGETKGTQRPRATLWSVRLSMMMRETLLLLPSL